MQYLAIPRYREVWYAAIPRYRGVWSPILRNTGVSWSVVSDTQQYLGIVGISLRYFAIPRYRAVWSPILSNCGICDGFPPGLELFSPLQECL